MHTNLYAIIFKTGNYKSYRTTPKPETEQQAQCGVSGSPSPSTQEAQVRALSLEAESQFKQHSNKITRREGEEKTNKQTTTKTRAFYNHWTEMKTKPSNNGRRISPSKKWRWYKSCYDKYERIHAPKMSAPFSLYNNGKTISCSSSSSHVLS